MSCLRPPASSHSSVIVTQDTIFETYTVQSAADANTINLEVPLGPLLKALRSAQSAISASIRLTKKNGVPLLSLTITTSLMPGPQAMTSAVPLARLNNRPPHSTDSPQPTEDEFYTNGDDFDETDLDYLPHPDRETTITQDIPIRVLAPQLVQGLHEPRTREHEVQIELPSLLQVKAVCDRFTKLALSSSKSSGQAPGFRGSAAAVPKLELAANMHGCLRLTLKTDAMNISSTWTGLVNPELDPGTVDVTTHPSTRMRELGDAEGLGEEGWAVVRLDGRDWSKVLGVGRLGGRVYACELHDGSIVPLRGITDDCLLTVLGLSHEHALVMYVWLPNDQTCDDESVLTVSKRDSDWYNAPLTASVLCQLLQRMSLLTCSNVCTCI